MGIFALLGTILLILVVFQFLIGKRIIKVDFKYHRYNGALILSIGLLKALLAILSDLF